MTKFLVLALVLLLSCAGDGVAQTTNQTQSGNQGSQSGSQGSTGNPTAPVQSLQPTQSACTTGSQSLRVCNDDFRSCSSVCTATALDPTAETAGCSLRCCTNFKACLSIRGCPNPTLNCF
jgi:hypothetical protein